MSEPTMRQAPADKGRFVFFPVSVAGMRSRNEDNYLVITFVEMGGTAGLLRDEKSEICPLDFWPSGFARIAVADGMGGHVGGREIAQAAVEGLINIPPFRSTEEARSAVLSLHENLYDQFSTNNDRSPGTTLVVADIELQTGLGFICNIGDSRAYEVKGKSIRLLTRDHTREEFEWRDGDISVQEYRQSLIGNTSQIIQALGHGSFGIIKEEDGYKPNRFDRRIRIDARGDLREEAKEHADVFPFSLEPGAAILLASDGLWNPEADGCWRGPLTEFFCSEAEAQMQVKRALDDGSKDNVTLMIFGYL